MSRPVKTYKRGLVRRVGDAPLISHLDDDDGCTC